MTAARSHLPLHVATVLIILGHVSTALVFGSTMDRTFLLLMCCMMAAVSAWQEYRRSVLPWSALLGSAFVLWLTSDPTPLISCVGIAVVHGALQVRGLHARARFVHYGLLSTAIIADVIASSSHSTVPVIVATIALSTLYFAVWLSVLPDVPELVYRASGSVFPLSFLALVALLLSTITHRLASLLVVHTSVIDIYPMVDGGLELIASTMLIIGASCLVITAGELLSGWEIKLWIVPAFLVTGGAAIAISILAYVIQLPILAGRTISEWYALIATTVVCIILLRTLYRAWSRLRYH
jgi:hypothetical protein